MKKIFIWFIIFILSIFSLNIVVASDTLEEKVDKVMVNFYLKLDKYDIEKKLSILDRINVKIISFKKEKWDNLTERQEVIFNRMVYSITKKIVFYKINIKILKDKENELIEDNKVIEKKDLDISNSNEDNIISYVKIKGENELIFDLVSWNSLRYEIFIDDKLTATIIDINKNIVKWGDWEIYWSIDLSDYSYVIWYNKIELKVYRDNKFITSIKPDYKILIRKWIDKEIIKENKLFKYVFSSSKKEVKVWEYIDLTVEWINEDWSNHILDSKYDHLLYFNGLKFDDNSINWTKFKNIFPYSMKWEYMKKTIQNFTKFSSHWIKIIKWCYEWDEYICWVVEVNVVEDPDVVKKEEYFNSIQKKYINLNFDWYSKIEWERNTSVTWYYLKITYKDNYKFTKNLDKETNSYILSNSVTSYWLNLHWSNLLIEVIWYTWDYSHWYWVEWKDYAVISKWTLKINNYYEKINLSEIKDSCSLDVDWINFKLDKCYIEKTYIKWWWDQKLLLKVIPSNTDEYYSYSTHSPNFLPDHSIWWWGSWSRKWIFEEELIIKDDKIDKGEYVWYISFYIYGKEWKSELKLWYKINVK